MSKLQEKLQLLCENEGYDSPEEMMEEYQLAGAVPAICINPDCDYCDFMEPDQDRGYCEECDTNTLKSCFILAGVI